MTSQLLILGNGFDLHCGLKSSYKDFFRYEILDTIGDSFGIKQLKAGVFGFWESILLEYYIEYGNQDYNWCVIEAIIKEVLELLFYGEKIEEINLENGIWYTALKFVNENRKLQNDEVYQNNQINRHIFKFCVKFFESIKLNCFSIQENLYLLSRQLLQELNNLENRFCKFLKNQIVNPNNQNERNEKYIVKAINLLANITGFLNGKYEDITQIIHKEEKRFKEGNNSNGAKIIWRDVNLLSEEFGNLKNVNILNFNYTALFDILEVENPCIYTNVHGKLCNNHCTKDCKFSNVIFGIDDNLIQSQGTSSELRLFSKTYRKMLVAGEPEDTLPPKNAKSLEIKFYGHSLSEADYSYFQSIFDYYDLYGNSNVRLLFYYSKGFEQHDTIYKLISSYGKSLNNKEQGKNLIHKLLLENRLKIIEIE